MDMNDNIIKFEKREETSEKKESIGDEHIPVENVLAGASMARLDEVIVIGSKSDGEFYVAASHGDLEVLMASLHAAVWKIVNSHLQSKN